MDLSDLHPTGLSYPPTKSVTMATNCHRGNPSSFPTGKLPTSEVSGGDLSVCLGFIHEKQGQPRYDRASQETGKAVMFDLRHATSRPCHVSAGKHTVYITPRTFPKATIEPIQGQF